MRLKRERGLTGAASLNTTLTSESQATTQKGGGVRGGCVGVADPRSQTHKTYSVKAVRSRRSRAGCGAICRRRRGTTQTSQSSSGESPPPHPALPLPASPGLLHSLPSVTPHTPNSISHGLLLPWQLHFPEASKPRSLHDK